MKRFLILTAALLAFSGLCAQNFKGSIHFRYSTQKDTTVNVYHVKEHMVKLDQYSRRNDNTVEGSFLFDLNAGEIKFLNPKRKLWGRQNSETPAVISGTCVVTKGRNVKSIAGLRCKEYIVRNVEENYRLSMNPFEYEYSSIDTYGSRRQYGMNQKTDVFSLFEFSAKWDPVPTMLCQNHTSTIQGFWGQTAAFAKQYIKKGVLIMGEAKAFNEARYIHGEHGKGTWTFYSGHDPEDYEHRVEEPPTDLSLHPNSPGYRLILNNILFPAAKKKKQKT